MRDLVFGSITRRSPLRDTAFDLMPVPQDRWADGDYVVAEVPLGRGVLGEVELTSGRMVEMVGGEHLVGCLGTRAATLSIVGSWRDVGEDLWFDQLTAANVFGKATSRAPMKPPPLRVKYLGHVVGDGRARNLADDALVNRGGGVRVPVVLIVGTSMEAGKTFAARTIIRRATLHGAVVAGTKLSGVGRYKDILAMSDAGADRVYDFVDAGLPSTVVPRERVAEAVDTVFSHLTPDTCDLVVVEAGASPLEPYNGDVIIEKLRDNLAFTVLCASDPYAVAGVQGAFGFEPDLVAGRATSTTAACDLVHLLTGSRGIDLLDRRQLGPLDDLLSRAGIDMAAPKGC